MAGRSTLSSPLPPMAPVARALPCVLGYSDLSDSELAFKAEFADKHLLMGCFSWFTCFITNEGQLDICFSVSGLRMCTELLDSDLLSTFLYT